MSKITITDAQGVLLGTIQQKFKLFKPTFKIFNANTDLMAQITGDWKAWNFVIKDSNYVQNTISHFQVTSYKNNCG